MECLFGPMLVAEIPTLLPLKCLWQNGQVVMLDSSSLLLISMVTQIHFNKDGSSIMSE